MGKKLVAVLLSLILLMSCLSVTALAADDKNPLVKSSEIEEKLEQVFAGYLGQYNAKITVSRQLLDLFKRGNLFGIRADKLANKLSDYVLVEAKDLGAAAGQYGTYTLRVLDKASGTTTVYIAVNIAEHPELYRLDCFHDAVTEMVAGQKTVVGYDKEKTVLMDYNRIAGELALHMIVYGVTAPIVYLQGSYTPSVIRQLYSQAKVAELNIDEDRAPSSLMSMLGGISDILYQITFGLFR